MNYWIAGKAGEIGARLAEELTARGLHGESACPEKLELLLYIAPCEAAEGDALDPEAMEAAYDALALGFARAVCEAMPALRAGSLRRIAVITDEECSLNLGGTRASLADEAALGALNMAVRLLFNRLRPEGFTFRLCCAGDDLRYVCEDILTNRCYDADEPLHSDENRLTLRDANGRELPW